MTTVKELEKKLEEVQAENQSLKDAGMMDLSEYVQKIDDLEKTKEKLENEVFNLKEQWARELREREQIEKDEKAKEDREKAPFRLDQTPHTRFRLLPKPYQRDIFGDVSQPVFNMGVTLDNYSGYVDIPMHVVIECAQSIGMLTYEQSEELKKDLEVETLRNEAAGRLGTVLADGINSLVDEFNNGLRAIDRTLVEEKLAGVSLDKESDADNGQSAGDSDVEEHDGVSDDSADSESDDDGSPFDLDDLDLDEL